MSRPAVRLAILAVLLLAGASPAAAQPGLTSFLRVVLNAPADLNGSVEVSPVDAPASSLSGPISGGSSVELGPLHAGRHEVRLVVGSLRAQTTITVGPARTVVLAAAVPSLREQPVLAVTAEYRRPQATTFLRSDLEALPSANDVWALVETAVPFVVADRTDGGGFGTGSATFVGGRGSSWSSTTVVYGDLALPYPFPDGTVPFIPDMGLIDNVLVSTGPMSIDTPTAGTTIFLMPRRPGHRRAGALDVSFSPSGLIAEGGTEIAPAIGEVESWSSFAGEIGGPIGERASGLLSVGTRRASVAERGRSSAHALLSQTVFGHVTARPGSDNEVRVAAGLQHSARAFAGRAQFADRDVQEHDTFWQARATWTRPVRGWQAEISGGLEHAALAPDLKSAAGGKVDRVFDGVVPDPPADTSWSRTDLRLALTSAGARFAGRSNRVRLVAGFSGQSASHTWLAAPDVAESVNGVPARVWRTTLSADESTRTIRTAWLGVQDELAVTDRLTLDLGLRADFSSGRADGGEDVGWSALSPRLAFRWALKGVTIYGGASRFFEPLRTDVLAFGDPGEPAREVYRWTDANADGAFASNEQGPLVAQAGRHASIASLDPDLRAPETGEVTLSGETRLKNTMTLRLTAVMRRQRHLLRALNTGVPLSSYDVIQVPDLDTNDTPRNGGLLDVYNRRPSSFGQDRYLLTNVADEDTHHEGLELEWELRTDRWYSMAGASASRSIGPSGSRGFRAQENDSGVIGERGDNPNAETFTHWRLFFDRAYVLKWSTAFRPSPDWTAAFTARYQDGQAFSRLVVVPDLNQGAEIVSADEPGTTRFTFLVTLDARIERTFRIGSRSVTARLDVFNLTNHKNEVEENPIGGPGFRTSTAMQPPRTVRLGVRIGF